MPHFKTWDSVYPISQQAGDEDTFNFEEAAEGEPQPDDQPEREPSEPGMHTPAPTPPDAPSSGATLIHQDIILTSAHAKETMETDWFI